MTYCLGMRLDAGLIFVSDTRTNAGVDSVATFRKSFLFDQADDRVIVILTAGNLAVSQSVISLLEERAASDDPAVSLQAAASMYDVATLVGRVVREVRDRDGDALVQAGADFNPSFIVGGQIRGRRMRLFNVYAAGNFVEATEDTPYFQIGETKYGKPIIERVLTTRTSLDQAVKCALVSFDSTIKGNLSVAPPLDLVILPADTCRVSVQRRIPDDDPYFADLTQRWGAGLRQLFGELPDPDWLREM